MAGGEGSGPGILNLLARLPIFTNRSEELDLMAVWL